MAKKLVAFEPALVNRAGRKRLDRVYRDAIGQEPEEARPEVEGLPVVGPRFPELGRFWSFPVRRPYHRMTGYQLAAANLLSAADMYEPAGPVLGIELLSGGQPFTMDPWALYQRRIVSSPNLLVGSSPGRWCSRW